VDALDRTCRRLINIGHAELLLAAAARSAGADLEPAPAAATGRSLA
jgi:hypothetical protein